MRREGRLTRREKLKLFSQREVEQLSGFTRSQLLKWEEAEIVKPNRDYGILYTWNQLIFLRILYHLRQVWSFKQIETGLINCNSTIEDILEDIDKHTFIALGIKVDKITFITPVEIKKILLSQLGDDELLEKKMEHLFSLVSLREHFLNVDNNSPIMTSYEMNKFNCITIPQIIEELKILGSQLQIENFNLKVG